MSDVTYRYKVVRHFSSGRKRIVRRGLFLWEAQTHCKDPESSSRTCTLSKNKRRTRDSGPWFDGYAVGRGTKRG